MKLNWNFQRGGGLRKKSLSGEVWIFRGITQFNKLFSWRKKLYWPKGPVINDMRLPNI